MFLNAALISKNAKYLCNYPRYRRIVSHFFDSNEEFETFMFHDTNYQENCSFSLTLLSKNVMQM